MCFCRSIYAGDSARRTRRSKCLSSRKDELRMPGQGEAHLHWHLYSPRTGDIDDYGNQGKGRSDGIRVNKCTTTAIPLLSMSWNH